MPPAAPLACSDARGPASALSHPAAPQHPPRPDTPKDTPGASPGALPRTPAASPSTQPASPRHPSEHPPARPKSPPRSPSTPPLPVPGTSDIPSRPYLAQRCRGPAASCGRARGSGGAGAGAGAGRGGPGAGRAPRSAGRGSGPGAGGSGCRGRGERHFVVVVVFLFLLLFLLRWVPFSFSFFPFFPLPPPPPPPFLLFFSKRFIYTFLTRQLIPFAHMQIKGNCGAAGFVLPNPLPIAPTPQWDNVAHAMQMHAEFGVLSFFLHDFRAPHVAACSTWLGWHCLFRDREKAVGCCEPCAVVSGPQPYG